jgi:tyrosine-protein kinase Etk/Wzc
VNEPVKSEEQVEIRQARIRSGDVDLFYLFQLATRYKRLALGFPITVAIIAAAIALLMPNIYKGTARIVIAQPQSTVNALMSQFAGAGALAGAAFGLKNPEEMYAAMLRSRTIADSLIKRFDLLNVYDEATMEDTREELADASDIHSNRDGIIVIAVEDKDAKRAADLANAYVEALDTITQTLAVTEAAQRRLFFERHLTTAKDNLATAEVALKATQETTGLIHLDGQAQVIISAAASLRGQIAAKQVEIRAMQAFATPQNAKLIVAQEELAGLRKELDGLERSQRTSGRGDIFLPTSKVPGAGLEYVRKLREVKYHEALFELLAKQFELAKIDEARDAPVIQVLDRAIAPDKKSKPKRALIVLGAAVIAGFVALLVTFTLDFLDRSPLDASQRRRLAALLRLAGIRRPTE